MKPRDLHTLRRLAGMFPVHESTDTPFIGSLTRIAKDNEAFRRVLHTSKELQLVVMTLPAKTDIGTETHAKVEQLIEVIAGSATAVIAGKRYPLTTEDTIAIPPGVAHNIINTGTTPLRLFSVYSPPNHPPGTVHATKEDAANDETDEAFSAKANR